MSTLHSDLSALTASPGYPQPVARRGARRGTFRRARFLTAALAIGLLGTASAVETVTRGTAVHGWAAGAAVSGMAWIVVLTAAIWRRTPAAAQGLALLCFMAATGEVLWLADKLLAMPGFHLWRFLSVIAGGQTLAGLTLLTSRSIGRLTTRSRHLQY